jgi:HSP20 family protein
MTMRRREHFDRLQDEIQELIDELWQVPRFSGMRHGFRPQIDVFRREEPAEINVVVELPGVEPERVHLFADDRTLLIAGERCRPQIDGRYQLMEIEDGPFQRRIALPEPVDAGAARATYARGLLTIVLPVAALPPQAETVTIQVVMQR